ncbi:MAG: hypothetical protein L6Q99_05395 [Planctomycetes bacterium]|nr:hypothetical protein [Planctomycetota bacterium]
MSTACQAFRDRLVAALEARGGRHSLGELGWHEHLLACAHCRRLLETEEALELLLDSLPEPKLPRELAERVLARLKDRTQRDALDELLERADPASAAPALARRVLAGLAAERAAVALDRLLERVPAPEAPAGLAERTLAKLALARRPSLATPERRVTPARRVWFAAAAAAVLVAGGVWAWRALLRGADRDEAAPIAEPTPNAPRVVPESAPKRALRNDGDAAAAPSDELLASLSVLESWELLNSENVDVMLSNLDAKDELLLELAAELATENDEPAETPTAEPKNG